MTLTDQHALLENVNSAFQLLAKCLRLERLASDVGDKFRRHHRNIHGSQQLVQVANEIVLDYLNRHVIDKCLDGDLVGGC